MDEAIDENENAGQQGAEPQIFDIDEEYEDIYLQPNEEEELIDPFYEISGVIPDQVAEDLTEEYIRPMPTNAEVENNVQEEISEAHNEGN